MTPHITSWLNELVSWSDPGLWVSLASILFLYSIIGFLPLSSRDDLTTSEALLLGLRRILLILFALLALLYPLIIWSLTVRVTGSIAKANQVVDIVIITPFWRMWILLLAGLLAGFLTKVVALRYLWPRLSGFHVFRRMSLRGDLVSDIRTESSRFCKMDFEPQKYYRDGKIFLGLDDGRRPVYLSTEDWKVWNQRMVGPTQTGKGVLYGVQLDQAIRQGFCTVFFDVKPDQHALGIMRKACEESGRQLVLLDFNGDLQGRWSPFRTGTDREIKTRLYQAFDLTERGDNADFYKQKERHFIESIFPQWNKELIELPKFIRKAEEQPVTVGNLTGEMLALKAVKPARGKGVDIERCLKENKVLYVRSSANDPVVKRLSQTFLLCLLQAATRLYRHKERTTHVFAGIDEVKFLATDILGDMLATITGFDCHLSIGYQSLGDLKSVNRKLVNIEALESSVENNCKMSLYYQPNDFETAEYAAAQSGTKQATRYRMNVNRNFAGGEVYDEKAQLTHEDVHYIHPNTLMMMPERVGMLKTPGNLAQIIHTHWIDIDPVYIDDRNWFGTKRNVNPSKR